MAMIEGIEIQNYRALKQVTLGKMSDTQRAEPLRPLTVVIGKNGTGKSTLFDAFGFLSDCLNYGVEAACDMPQRGGFDRLRSRGSEKPIQFGIRYVEVPNERPITYDLAIDVDKTGRPFVRAESLKQRRQVKRAGRPFYFLRLERGKGTVWSGESAVDTEEKPDADDPSRHSVELTDLRQLGIATLGTLKEHPRIARFRDFLKGWYLSYFTPDAARSLPVAGAQRHLNVHGDNLANVVQFMERDQPARFRQVLARIAAKIPGVTSIETKVTDDRRVLLRFNDGALQDPFLAQQMSDGTLKMFAYLLLLEDPAPPPFVCIEEPENGLYHKLLESLAREFREKATGKRGAPQIFVTTHQPYFVDALAPEEVWVLEKGHDGFSAVTRASDIELVTNLVREDLPLGALWYSDYLDRQQ